MEWILLETHRKKKKGLEKKESVFCRRRILTPLLLFFHTPPALPNQLQTRF